MFLLFLVFRPDIALKFRAELADRRAQTLNKSCEATSKIKLIFLNFRNLRHKPNQVNCLENPERNELRLLQNRETFDNDT